MNSTETFKAKIAALQVWKRSDQRAPHKPLLLLYALARYSRGEERMIPYAEIDPALQKLLAEFGPYRQTYRATYPFWRLQNDGLWELSAPKEIMQLGSNADPAKGILLQHHVAGGIPLTYYERIRQDPALLETVVHQLLESHFPETLHEDILEAVGMSSQWGLSDVRHKRRRDPGFRDRVLAAYQYRCAICGLDIRLGTHPIALEAAHIQWHQAGGPDDISNGLALCILHHKLLDRGAIAFSPEKVLIVSEQVSGYGGLQEWVFRFAGKAIALPVNSLNEPQPKYLRWHQREVFKGKI